MYYINIIMHYIKIIAIHEIYNYINLFFLNLNIDKLINI